MKSVRRADNLKFEGLSEAVEDKIEKYLRMYDGVNAPTGLYEVTIKEIEKVLLNVTMRYSDGNKVKAARVLGINRNTLHKKLMMLDFNNEN